MPRLAANQWSFVSLAATKAATSIRKRLAMTSTNLDRLTEAGQTDVIWENGVFLDRRKESFYNILLFQLDGFYTEVYYHSHFNVIIKISSFSDTDGLAPYLDKINLHSLFND